jgi:tRNA-specific 2-thiouridylase
LFALRAFFNKKGLKMLNKKCKILVAMSGGVDSSVAAVLLVKKGYDVTGAFMVNFDDSKRAESCWRGDYHDALRVCAKLGIKLLRLDFQKEYKRDVLNYMYKEYSTGRTPNPDILCNKFIKFGAWMKKAKDLGFDYIATGHYARVKTEKRTIDLLVAKDKIKDQTYFLHQLNQKQLKHALFPVGDYTKKQVRALAKKFDLPTAEKEESMGICFVGEVPMKEFLKDKVKSKKGKIITTGGKIIGEHYGLAFYTIGERGIGLNSIEGKPLFVVDKNIKRNELVVGFKDDAKMFKTQILISNISWISGHAPKFPLKCKVRLRHRQDLQDCVVNKKNNKILINFASAQRAVTPGQFAVIYSKGRCLGGGVII